MAVLAIGLGCYTFLGAQTCDQDVAVKVVCPTIMQYDQPFQNRMLAELRALPPGSALRQFVGDQTRLRDQVRACRARAAKGQAGA